MMQPPDNPERPDDAGNHYPGGWHPPQVPQGHQGAPQYGQYPQQPHYGDPGGYGPNQPWQYDEYGRAVQMRRGPRGSIVFGWVMIILGCLMMFGLQWLGTVAVPEDEPDQLGPLMMEIQGKYMTGAADFMPGSRTQLYNQAYDMLNLGSVTQRHQFIVLAAELGGPDAAGSALQDMDRLIEEEDSKRNARDGDEAKPTLTEEQRAVHEILHLLYSPAESADEGEGNLEMPDAVAAADPWQQTRERINALTTDQIDLLHEKLGWFGQVATAPPGTDRDKDRRAVERSGTVVLVTVVSVVTVLAAAGLCGLVALVIVVVFALNGKMMSGVPPGAVHHGLYAETFGIWMVLFPLGQLAAGLVQPFAPALAMPAVLLAFFGSLVVLAWPVLRGARWSDVRADIGLTLGRNPAAEPFVGVLGYAMGLPMLAIGLVLTFVLLAVQSVFAAEPEVFDPAGGPAHPVILELGGPSIWPKVMILLLAAVAAPIVEEIMFRGVLYRHLRDASRGLGLFLSIVISATASGFIFAAIHPQGWVAIPALMGLAFAFCLVREWRGTLIPAILIHAISNFLVMTMLIVILSA